MRKHPKRFLVGAFIVLSVAAGSVAAAAPSGSEQQDGAPVQFAPARGDLPIVSGSPGDVVNTLASRFSLVSNAHLLTETIPAEEGARTPGTLGTVLAYDLNVASMEGAAITRALWEGNMLAGAVADEFLARGFEQLVGAQGTLVTPAGDRKLIGGGVAHVVTDQIFDSVPAGLEQTAAAAGRPMGLRNVALTRIAGLQQGVVVNAETDAPASTAASLLRTGALDALLGGRATRFEGAFLEIRDTNGEPVFIEGLAPRAGARTMWIKPSLGLQIPGVPHVYPFR